MSAAIWPFFFASRICGGGGGQHDVTWMLAHLFADRIDLLKGALHGFGAGNFAGNPDRKENRVQAAFLHARNIDAAGISALTEIEFAIEKALRGVVVSVHHNGRKMEFARFL